MIAEGASLDHSDLYVFDVLYFKKNESIPFSGEITGRVMAKFVQGLWMVRINNTITMANSLESATKMGKKWQVDQLSQNGQLHSKVNIKMEMGRSVLIFMKWTNQIRGTIVMVKELNKKSQIGTNDFIFAHSNSYHHINLYRNNHTIAFQKV